VKRLLDIITEPDNTITNMSYDPAWPNTARYPVDFTAQLTISRPTDTTQETIQETEENELDILCKIIEDAGYTVTLNECYLQAK